MPNLTMREIDESITSCAKIAMGERCVGVEIFGVVLWYRKPTRCEIALAHLALYLLREQLPG